MYTLCEFLTFTKGIEYLVAILFMTIFCDFFRLLARD